LARTDGAPAFGRRRAGEEIDKNKHHTIKGCLFLPISSPVGRAQRGAIGPHLCASSAPLHLCV
jgi:hypothetical protein